jgi:hypothetical protein
MIAFSLCNKSFKPLWLPSGRMKSSEGLPKMIPTNIMQDHVIHKIEVSQKQWFSFISKLNNTNSIFTILGN